MVKESHPAPGHRRMQQWRTPSCSWWHSAPAASRTFPSKVCCLGTPCPSSRTLTPLHFHQPTGKPPEEDPRQQDWWHCGPKLSRLSVWPLPGPGTWLGLRAHPKGRKPAPTVSTSCAREHGKSDLETQRETLEPGQKVIVVDDLLAEPCV